MFDRETKMLQRQTNHDSSRINGEKFRTIPIDRFVYRPSRPSTLCLPERLLSFNLAVWIDFTPGFGYMVRNVHKFPLDADLLKCFLF